MSIFNTKYANGIDIRGNSCYFEDIYQKNHLNDEFERVGGSGEGPSLPDWVRDNSIRFRDSEVILNGPKLNSIEEDHQKLTTIETIVLPAHEASLEELDTRVLTNSNKIAGITRPTATATLISSNNGKFYMDPNACYVFNSSATFPTAPYLKLKPSSIELFTTASSSVYLDVNRIDKLARILQVTDSVWDANFSITKPLLLTGTVAAANNTNKKMLVVDSTSKLVNYMDIPSTVIPSYIKPNFISIGDSTQSLSMTNTALEFFRERNGNSELILLDFDTLEGIIAGSTYKKPKYKLLSLENNELLPFTVESGIITIGGTVQPFNFNLNEGEKVIFGPATSVMKVNTWYGFLLNGGDVNKQPSYRLSVNSDSTINIPNNTDDYYTIVSKALIYDVGGGGNKRYICFKIVNLKDTTNNTKIVPTPTFITLEFLKSHVYDNPAY